MPLPSKRSAIIIALVLTGTVFALKQAQELGFARRNVPPACAVALSDLDRASAKGSGVALRSCARARVDEKRSARIVGRWIYGPAEAPVDGFVVYLRDRRQTPPADTLMHVSVDESRLRLNDIFAQGAGCAGGLVSAQIEGDSLSHVVSLTPAALADRRGQDISNDAADCAAEQVFINRVVQLLVLKVPARRSINSADQACLDNVIADSITAGKASLTMPAGYQEFMAALTRRCPFTKTTK